MAKAKETYVFKGIIILPGDELPKDPEFKPAGKDMPVKKEK